MLECVVNISEGRSLETVAALAMLAGPDLLDAHSDPDHNRSVLTLVGTEAVRDVARGAVEVLDIRDHSGVHPRLGVVDVVPFVPLDGSQYSDALQARNEFAEYASTDLSVPCFLYGPERTLPEIRRSAFKSLAPDLGPRSPHETAGAMCIGVREVLIAYNIFLDSDDLAIAQRIAREIRSDDVRALGMKVGGRAQVSMNLVNPLSTNPHHVAEKINRLAKIYSTELVGLIPAAVLTQIPKEHWEALDLGVEKTIEWQLASRNRRLNES